MDHQDEPSQSIFTDQWLTHSNPILNLREDVLNFLEAIDPHPGSELNNTGFKFAKLLKELYYLYESESTIDHIKNCWHLPDNH